MRIDTLLVRTQLAAPDGLQEAAQRWRAGASLALRIGCVAWSPASTWAYVYAHLAAPAQVAAQDVARLVQSWSDLCPHAAQIDVSRLELVQDLPGRSSGAVATRHYAVETDPEAGWDEELARWYAQEHMPGLAAVDGCIHARRFLNHDQGPRSHACYELVTEDTLGSPPWLAIRGTAWSSRVRPHFTNTRRTMFEVVE